MKSTQKLVRHFALGAYECVKWALLSVHGCRLVLVEDTGLILTLQDYSDEIIKRGTS